VLFFDMERGTGTRGDCQAVLRDNHPLERNKFAALNTAVWSGGSIVYVVRRPDRDAAPGLLPDQRGEHGPVRANADHRRRERLRAIRRQRAAPGRRGEGRPRRAEHNLVDYLQVDLQERGCAGYRGLLQVAKGATNAKSKVVCDALILDEESRSDTYPYIDIDENRVGIGHEATVSKIGGEQLFYLMSRGLSQSEASARVVAGFVEPIVKELPLEYAINMNRPHPDGRLDRYTVGARRGRTRATERLSSPVAILFHHVPAPRGSSADPRST
jgi:SUF system FeS cluster assembly, SufBD